MQIVVGGTYLDCAGREVVITSDAKYGTFHFWGNNGEESDMYSTDGSRFRQGRGDGRLVSEVDTLANNSKKLILNSAFDIQFEGDYHNNGYPKLIAKVHIRENSFGVDPNLFDRVKILQEMIDSWNERQAVSSTKGV